ncbi:hypothetical protein ASG87_12935 [Frateuria sp. Soil773]|uniref:hypothetical protein n=1 Tax=Frateuria sp. Soil773 TaxID=1736407 RepID=UPI0006F78626|nr:hypothetical protein [Frateuria sp. Soil773]KRF00587.1 hypothetical protein ASG87_12935 [Frateuria sp. Soil773]
MAFAGIRDSGFGIRESVARQGFSRVEVVRRHGRHLLAQALPLLPLAWLLFAGAMAWLWRRGWRGLMQRPHPFLAG